MVDHPLGFDEDVVSVEFASVDLLALSVPTATNVVGQLPSILQFVVGVEGTSKH